MPKASNLPTITGPTPEILDKSSPSACLAAFLGAAFGASSFLGAALGLGAAFFAAGFFQ